MTIMTIEHIEKIEMIGGGKTFNDSDLFNAQKNRWSPNEISSCIAIKPCQRRNYGPPADAAGP